MNLSPHFTLAELSRTSRDAFRAENEHEAAMHVDSLTALCTDLLEPIRAHFGAPVVIHSGFRCQALNDATPGSSKVSQHMKGEAADFHVEGRSLEEVWTWIWRDSGLSVGQVLLEGHGGPPAWIHLSLGPPWRPAAKSQQHFRIEDSTK